MLIEEQTGTQKTCHSQPLSTNEDFLEVVHQYSFPDIETTGYNTVQTLVEILPSDPDMTT